MGLQCSRGWWSDYIPLESQEAAPAEQNEDESLMGKESVAQRRHSKTMLVFSLANVVLFLMTAGMMVAMTRGPGSRLLNAELRATSSYSMSIPQYFYQTPAEFL
jgi:hypothetical protein